MAPRSNSERLSPLERFTIVVLGVYLASVGLHVLGDHRVIYSNYLHRPVLAPVALIIGVILITAGLVMRP